MKLLALVFAVLLTGCASGLRMTDEEAAICKQEGCTAWTAGEIADLIKHSFGMGYRAGAKANGRAL